MLVRTIRSEVTDGATEIGADPGDAELREDIEASVDGETTDEPGCKVSVIPPVVIATGLVLDAGKVIVSEPITMTLGPRRIVLVPCVIVDVSVPNMNVVPPSTISVLDDPGRGIDGVFDGFIPVQG